MIVVIDSQIKKYVSMLDSKLKIPRDMNVMLDNLTVFEFLFVSRVIARFHAEYEFVVFLCGMHYLL